MFIDAEAPFELGKIQKVISGTDLTIAAWPPRVGGGSGRCRTSKDGIHAEVLNVHTPATDEKTLIESAQTGHVLVAEEHQRLGGLGSSGTMSGRKPPHSDGLCGRGPIWGKRHASTIDAEIRLGCAPIVRKSKALLGK